MGAYAAANAFQDAFARARGWPWMSINWDGWRREEEAPGTGQAGLALTPAEGAQAFERILVLGGLPQVIVSTADLQVRKANWEQSLSAAAQAPEEQLAAAAYERPALRTSFVPPSNELERQIAEIWQEELNVTPVGIHDDFFELGGQSLLAVRLISRLRKKFGAEVSLEDFLMTPTVMGLVRAVLQAQAQTLAPALVTDMLDELETRRQ
jgi:acyl carrier protein